MVVTQVGAMKRPKESPTDPMRLARRVHTLLGWRWDFTTQQFIDATGAAVPEGEVEPRLLAVLKHEIDTAPILGPKGRAAALYVDIIPATVIAAVKALCVR